MEDEKKTGPEGSEIFRMQGFFGVSHHNMDAKGRLLIPVLYREQLGNSFAMTLDPEDNAINIYPDRAFYAMIQKLFAMNQQKPAVQKFLEHLAKYSFPGSQLDPQGRVLIPPILRDYVMVEAQEVAIIGAFDHLRVTSMAVSEDEDRYYHEHKDEIREIVADLNSGRFAPEE